ncbi:unnamed protein product [Parascedosporium putredinis]|uniref:AMP-dependent synthetase/ligase domain-containing protein n=1 Tax=Parascedosporium putredinis TaxID=1442378 RepID=A0A9P1GY64_9PEZI|nr:unnamed protein product [Parascedosporium putredinis]CAI7989648.1 unnamed protein product [Parascedosporium putredinis]
MPARIHKSPFRDLNLVQDDLLSFLLSNSRNHPADKPLFVDAISGESYTYAETIRRTKSLAHGLRQLGVKPGDIVGVLHQLTVSGAQYIIAHETLIDTARTAAAKGTKLRHILRDRLATTCPSTEPLVSVPKERLATQPAFICFSSGTTGAAKGVEISHNNVTANIQQWQELYYSEVAPSPTAVAFLPFSHIYAINAIICGGLYRGTTMVVLPRFDLDVYLRSIQNYKPDELHLRAPHHVGCGALSAELGDAVEKRFKDAYGTTVHCHQGWGLTETSPAVTGIHTSHWHMRRTVGCVGPNMEIRLVDNDTGEDVTDWAQQGEVWVRGPNVVIGYYGNEEATKESFHVDEEGRRWFKTGDIATIDADGFVVIRDRIKEMIKYKGLQVIPSELEGKLLQHPTSRTAASPRSDATPKSVVDGIHAWLNERVANHKKLRGGIRVVDAIPKSPSGKILRRVLKDSLKAKPTASKL